MLRFFRINDPYRLFFIFLILVIIRVVQSFFIEGISFYGLKWMLLAEWLDRGFMMYTEAYDYTGPLAAFIFKYTDFFFGRSYFAIYALSTLLIIVQAGIFNQLLLRNKAYDENSYLPAFLYVILMAAVPDFMMLSPQLLSLTFILIAFRNVLRRIDNQVTDELFLNSGLFIGLATMIYLPAVVYFLVFLFSLILFSTAVVRRLTLYLFGFLLVFTLCTIYFFWFDAMDVFIDSFVIAGFTLPSLFSISLTEWMYLGGPFIFLFLISVWKTMTTARLTNFQQKVQQVIWLMFFGALATLFLSVEQAAFELVFFVPVITYFWTHYFILIRRRFFKLVMPGLLIFGLLTFSCYSYTNLVLSLIIEPSQSSESNAMVIGEEIAYYTHEQSNSPCFSQQLCEAAFAGLDYYESATTIYEMMVEVDPDVIIDQVGVSQKLFERFPEMARKYKREEKGIYRKVNN